MNTIELRMPPLLPALIRTPAGLQPAQIILQEHAATRDDPAAEHLSARGTERAFVLVSLLGRNSLFTSNAPVVALYATHVTEHDHGQRTGRTLAWLIRDFRLPSNTTCDSDNYSLLAANALQNPAYRRETVIVCWTPTTLNNSRMHSKCV